jgi:hypothetical protein
VKKLFLLFLFLLGFNQTKAQSASESQLSKWSIGIRAGGSLLPDFENQLQNNFKMGINGGIYGAYKLNKHISLKTELGFSQRGKSYSYTETQSLFTSFNEIIGAIVDTNIIGGIQGFVDDGVYSNYEGYHKTTYFEIPLLSEITLYKFKLTTGPYVGFLMRSYTKESLDQNIPLLDLISPAIDSLGFAAIFVESLISASFPGYRETYNSESTSTDIFTKLNYGILFQLSYQLHQNTFLEARFTRSLNNYLLDDPKNKQLSNFTLSVAYNFGLKKLKK